MSKPLNKIISHASVLPTPRRGIDKFTFIPPEGEVLHSCRLTLHKSRPDSGAKIIAQPNLAEKGSQVIQVEWWHNGATNLCYQLEGFSTLAQSYPPVESLTQQLAGFKPDRHGFHFNNAFPPYPDITLSTPFGKIKIGNAKDGLCGGMILTSLDFYHAGLPIPDTTTPPTGDMLFDYLVTRLFDSFNLPLGIGKYVELMNPHLPDGESDASKRGLALHGRSWQTIREEWPVIKTLLDSGQPCPLGLVRIKSTDIRKLGLNHQVLCYGYDVTGDNLTLFIYDPNYHDDNNIRITLNLAAPESSTQIIYSTGEPLYAFFHVNYKFRMPLASGTASGRILIFEQPNFTGHMKDIHTGSPNLALVDNGIFNDQISSFIIVNGNWMLYKNRGFNSPYLRNGKPLVLGPGHYPRLEPLGILDNDISSLKAVAMQANY